MRDLTHNALTAAGVRALRATKVKVVAKDQWQPGDDSGDWGDEEYLFAGDIE